MNPFDALRYQIVAGAAILLAVFAVLRLAVWLTGFRRVVKSRHAVAADFYHDDHGGVVHDHVTAVPCVLYRHRSGLNDVWWGHFTYDKRHETACRGKDRDHYTFPLNVTIQFEDGRVANARLYSWKNHRGIKGCLIGAEVYFVGTSTLSD